MKTYSYYLLLKALLICFGVVIFIHGVQGAGMERSNKVNNEDLIFYNGTSQTFTITLLDRNDGDIMTLAIVPGVNNLGPLEESSYTLTMPHIPAVTSGAMSFYWGCSGFPSDEWIILGDNMIIEDYWLPAGCINRISLNEEPNYVPPVPPENFDLIFYNGTREEFTIRMESTGFANGEYYQAFNIVPGENNLGAFHSASVTMFFPSEYNILPGSTKLIWNCNEVETSELVAKDWQTWIKDKPLFASSCGYHIGLFPVPEKNIDLTFQNNTSNLFTISLLKRSGQEYSFNVSPGINNLGIVTEGEYQLHTPVLPEIVTGAVKLTWEGVLVPETDWHKGEEMELDWKRLTATANSPQLILAVDPDYVPRLNKPDYTRNFIAANTYRSAFDSIPSNPDASYINQQVVYYDGLGRQAQSIQVMGSPGYQDLIVPYEYDAMGREARKYLPYVSGLDIAAFRYDAVNKVRDFYNPSGSGAQLPGGIARNTAAFAEVRFEPSPLSRVVEQGAPGADWQIGSGHTVRTDYYSNDASSLSAGSGLWAKKYGVTVSSDGVRSLADQGSYGINQLYVTELKDENWKESDGKAGIIHEYKDKDGRIVLRRIWDDLSAALSTYYIYDDYGNLTYVLPPKAEADNGGISADVLNNLCYQYDYDDQNRIWKKKLPGKEWEYIIYNKLDQIVAGQDGEQRKRNEWSIIKYDGLGRTVITGLWNNNNTPITPQALRELVYTTRQWDVKNIARANGYQIDSYPQVLNTVLTVNYYDSYDIPDLPADYDRHINYSDRTGGLNTGSKVAVLNKPLDMLWAMNYYDDEGRVVKNISQHYKGGVLNEGNYDETDCTYSFMDELLSSIRSHKVSGAEQVKIRIRYEYDHMGRKISTWQKINNADSVLLSKNDYNEIGQLIRKNLHSASGGQPIAEDLSLNGSDVVQPGQQRTVTAAKSITLLPGFEAKEGSAFYAHISAQTFLQTIQYAYNERGWLKQINTPGEITGEKAFGMTLLYNDHAEASGKQYNGNISAVIWQTKIPAAYQSSFPQEQQSYDYRYDKLNRLTLADYTTPGKAGYFNESLSYDKGGNMVSLSRTGNGSEIDSLSYTYENSGQSNRLYRVTNLSGDNRGQPAGAAAEYTYDENGSMISDSKKNIRMEYNQLNLPQKITVGGNQIITYFYDAGGRKLRKEGPAGNRDYIEGIEYDNGNLEFVQTEEGRAAKNGDDYSYEYMLRDHLGNTRAMVKQDGSILQVNDYYAFGMQMDHNRINPSLDNRYKYNGKELQDELGLYDFGARFYDAVVGRWMVVDPLAEQYRRWSPFNYGVDNPIRFVDPDGMGLEDWVKDKFGKIHWDQNATSQNTTKKDETYIGREFKTRTASYYNDGSVFFKNETEAYNYMWDNSNAGGQSSAMRENAAWLTKDGVAVLPTSGTTSDGKPFKNGVDGATFNIYDVEGKGNSLSVNFHDQIIHPIASLHTHPGGGVFTDGRPSSKDIGFVKTSLVPGFVIHPTDVYGVSVSDARSNQYQTIMTHNQLLRQGFKLIPNLNLLQ